MEKRKVKIAVQVLHEMSFPFPNTKEFINKKLEQICSKEYISLEEVIYFSLASLEKKCVFF